jgi:hypothetical protein
MANNPEGLVDFLRAAGLPESTIRSFIKTLLQTRAVERFKAVSSKYDTSQTWWKDKPSNLYHKEMAELFKSLRESQKEAARVLGTGAESLDWTQDLRLTFLSSDKLNTVQTIQHDYEDLIYALQRDMEIFQLPGDADKMKFLKEEKKRDLVAALSPQEWAEYNLRNSDTANHLRRKTSWIDCSEDEYRKLFALQKAHDDTQNLDGSGNPINPGAVDWQKRQENESRLKAQFKDSLGAERYADYARAQNREYQTLIAATERLSLPSEIARQVFDLRTTVSSESVRIVDSPDLGAEQKKQALAALAQTTRSQIRARLGAAAAESYMKNHTDWLTKVETGNAVTFDEEGNSNNVRGISTPKPKPDAAK